MLVLKMRLDPVLCFWGGRGGLRPEEAPEAVEGKPGPVGAVVQLIADLVQDLVEEKGPEDASFVPAPPVRHSFLWAFLFDKVLYEIRYELNHRPDWARLPLHGLRRLLGAQAPTASPEA